MDNELQLRWGLSKAPLNPEGVGYKASTAPQPWMRSRNSSTCRELLQELRPCSPDPDGSKTQLCLGTTEFRTRGRSRPQLLSGSAIPVTPGQGLPSRPWVFPRGSPRNSQVSAEGAVGRSAAQISCFLQAPLPSGVFGKGRRVIYSGLSRWDTPHIPRGQRAQGHHNLSFIKGSAPPHPLQGQTMPCWRVPWHRDMGRAGAWSAKNIFSPQDVEQTFTTCHSLMISRRQRLIFE